MKKRALTLCAALFIVIGMLPGGLAADTAQKTDTLQVYYIDVGQGDSEFVELPNGETMLIDAGKDNGKAEAYLKELGCKKIDYVVATHPDADHIGGMTDIIEDFTIGEFYMPDVSNTTKTYESMLNALEKRDVACYYAQAGVSLCREGDLSVTCLSPQDGIKYDSKNDYSAVIRVSYDDTSFLFTGDAEERAETQMLKKYSAKELRSDVLKVSHHGSSTASTQAFLQAVSPTYAVISVGTNSYGHPTQTVLDRLSALGVRCFRTDTDGTTVISSDGTEISTQTTGEGDGLSAPKNCTAVSASATSLNVSWGGVSRADGYVLYRSTSKNGSYQKIRTTAATSYTDTGLSSGTTYFYRVQTYVKQNGASKLGALSDVVSATATLGKVSGLKASRASASAIKLSWNKVVGASGYQVVRSTKKSGSYKAVKTTGSRSYTNKKLSKGKTYYYKVRAYQTVSGKRVYGAYSAVVSKRLSSDASASATVYVTKTGECYHKISQCGRGTYYATTLAEVKASGLRACEKCW